MPSVIRGNDNFDSSGGNAVKAWVNFNGTGTVAIRAAFNVTSITDNGTGNYTVNFTNAIADANYAVSALGCNASGNGCVATIDDAATVPTTSLVRIIYSTSFSGGVATDQARAMVTIFR